MFEYTLSKADLAVEEHGYCEEIQPSEEAIKAYYEEQEIVEVPPIVEGAELMF